MCRIPKEFLGAFKAGHRLKARAFIDEDLSYKLLEKVIRDNCQESRKLLQYITKFNNEYYRSVIRKGDDTSIHCTNDLRLNCLERENSRNRDIYWRLPFAEPVVEDYLRSKQEENKKDPYEDIDF